MATIYIGADHAGYDLKEKLKRWLSRSHTVVDCGNKRYDAGDDYPVFVERVAREVAAHGGFGILACGTAEGVCIAANKVPGARAVAPGAVATATLARSHNNANVLCLAGGKTVTKTKGLGTPFPTARRIVTTFLTTPFSAITRHRRRVRQIQAIERRC